METNQGLFLLHLLRFPGRYQSEMMRRLTGRGYEDLRLGFGPVVTVLARGSLRLTDLARQLDMQKQNCTQLVRRLEDAGYVERRADPTDKRSRLLALTARGEALVRDGVAVILELDAELAAVVGDRAFADFSGAVHLLHAAVCAPDDPGPGDPNPGDPDPGDPVPGTLINELIRLAASTGAALNALVRARGYMAIRPVHEQVLLHLGEGRVRIQDIARENDVSRQAISAIVNELQSLGFIRLDVDPTDARGRIIRLTDKGNTLVQHSAEAAQGLLRRYIAELGKGQFDDLVATFAALYQHLDAAVRQGDGVSDQPSSPATDIADFVLQRLGGGALEGDGAGETAVLRSRVEQYLEARDLADLEQILSRILARGRLS